MKWGGFFLLGRASPSLNLFDPFHYRWFKAIEKANMDISFLDELWGCYIPIWSAGGVQLEIDIDSFVQWTQE